MRNIDRTAYRDIHNRIMDQGGALEFNALLPVAVMRDDPHEVVMIPVRRCHKIGTCYPQPATLAVRSNRPVARISRSALLKFSAEFIKRHFISPIEARADELAKAVFVD